jgi:HEAT repeat protein
MADRRVASWVIGLLLGCIACGGQPEEGMEFEVAETEDPPSIEQPPEYWAAQLGSRSATDRREALGMLGEYGREASSYAPVVARLLADPDERTGATAAWALANMGMSAHPLLIARLDSPDPRIRKRAAYGVGEMGPDGAVAIERLKELATDPDRGVRSMAVWATDQVTLRSMEADPTMVLTEGLDGTREQRLEAVDRLGARAHSSRVAVRQLIRLMSDSVPVIRARSIQALSEAGPSVLPSLSAALSHRNRLIRNGALLAISKMHRTF